MFIGWSVTGVDFYHMAYSTLLYLSTQLREHIHVLW